MDLMLSRGHTALMPAILLRAPCSLPAEPLRMTDTRTARIGLSESGLLIVRIRTGLHQSLADAKVNLAVALSETAGRHRPLLVDIRTGRQPIDADVRHHYSGQTLVEGFSALALLVEASPLGRMMGNVYLRIARPGIPTQLFSDEARALEWLIEYRL